eukprot:4562060-Pyramimonas_sp.AAC.1
MNPKSARTTECGGVTPHSCKLGTTQHVGHERHGPKFGRGPCTARADRCTRDPPANGNELEDQERADAIAGRRSSQPRWGHRAQSFVARRWRWAPGPAAAPDAAPSSAP